jgi:WD40 repeat protein
VAEISWPADDSWVAAVHATKGDYTALGAAVVLDPRRLLTSAHVVRATWEAQGKLWIAFPKADLLVTRRMVTEVILAESDVADLALLFLAADVPDGVALAPLKNPKAKLLVNRSWHAFGFADGDPLGNSADGTVGADLGYGWIRLDTRSRYHLEPGFSGTGVWSSDYDAVIGIVGQANGPGDGRAMTFHFADAYFPGQNLQELTKWTVGQAGRDALQAWGWTLAQDPQAKAHWKPRARGVTVDSEPGHRFRGRTAALRAVVGWLGREVPARKALVVTGSPGVGKSAVLGRIVVTADPDFRAALPADDAAVRAPAGAVSCAVHAKGKTAIDIAAEIARAASAELSEDPADLPPALRAALSDRGGGRFNVVIDALDEAVSPVEARRVIKQIVLPLVETCASAGVQVIVGTRRHDDGGDLLESFGNALSQIDLDESDFFALDDLAAYSLATLQLAGDPRPDNPYNDDDIAVAVSGRIAELSDRNFLVAGLVARTHGMHDETAILPGHISFTATVEDALRAYIDRIAPVAGISAYGVLTALAFAQSGGLTLGLWRVAIEAITGTSIEPEALAQFTHSSAGNFLIESGRDGEISAYRLFHQALNDTLLDNRRNSRPAETDEGSLTRAFMAFGHQVGWDAAPVYLLQSLPVHAARADLIDELLVDDDYLLHADLRRIIPLAEAAATGPGRNRARLLQLTPQAMGAPPDLRAAAFSITEMLEGLGHSYSQADTGAPYQAVWASAGPRGERALFEGHTETINGLCSISFPGRSLVASAGDTTVRIWDLVTGQVQHMLSCDGATAESVCTFTGSGRTSVAAACTDGHIYLWDLDTGTLLRKLAGHSGTVNAVYAFQAEGQALLASAGHDRTVRVWNPHTGHSHVLRGHEFSVNDVCAFTENGQVFLASAGGDDTIRVWDPIAGEPAGTLTGHVGPVNGVCAFTVNGQAFLASAGGDDTIRVWDLRRRQVQNVLTGHTFAVRAVCAFAYEGQAYVASVGDNTVRLWNMATGGQQILGSHTGPARAICPVTQGARTLIASAGSDKAIRIWDVASTEERTSARSAAVTSVTAFRHDGRPLLATGGADGDVRLWTMDDGELLWDYGEIRPAGDPDDPLRGPITSLSYFRSNVPGMWRFLVYAGANGICTVVIPADRSLVTGSIAMRTPINAFAVTSVDEGLIAASADDSHQIFFYDHTRDMQFSRLEDPIVEQVDAVALYIGRFGEHLRVIAGDDNGVIRTWQLVQAGYPDGSDESSFFGPGRIRRSSRRGYSQVRARLIDRVYYQSVPVTSLSMVRLGWRQVLVSTGHSDDIYLWPMEGGGAQQPLAILKGHTGTVNGICSFKRGHRTFLASASDDRTLRIWNMDTRVTELTIPVQREALSICFRDGILYAGLLAGSIAVRVNFT